MKENYDYGREIWNSISVQLRVIGVHHKCATTTTTTTTHDISVITPLLSRYHHRMRIN